MSKKLTVRPFGWQDKLGYTADDFGCNMSCAIITSYMMLVPQLLFENNEPVGSRFPPDLGSGRYQLRRFYDDLFPVHRTDPSCQ